MNMIPPKPTTATTQRGRDCFVLYNIGWQGYNKILEEVGNREYRITYSPGNLELMSPLPVHELLQARICLFLRDDGAGDRLVSRRRFGFHHVSA